MTARLLAASLLLALIAVLSWQSCQSDSASSPALGATGPTTRKPTGVSGMPLGRLAAAARLAARHGGVRGRCFGCATRWMKLLSSALVARAFPAWSRPWAECVVSNESGFNPGAISTADDYGLAQFHLGLWPVDELRMLRDPWLAARSFARVSRYGKIRWPWKADRGC